MFYETKQYIDNEGRTIYEQTSLVDKKDIKFFGTFPAQTKEGVYPFSFEFPEDKNLDECIDCFDEYAKEKMEEYNAENKAKSEAEAKTSEEIANPDNLITIPS